MSTTAIAAVDVETTGLDVSVHEVWEFAAVLADHDPAAATITVTDIIHLDIPCQLATADPGALRVGGYYTRRHRVTLAGPGGDDGPPVPRQLPSVAAQIIAPALAGRHLIGANPSFDAAFIGRLLRRHGHAPAWPHHMIDVSPLVAGYLQGVGHAQHDTGATAHRHDDLIDTGVPPYRSSDLAEAIGVQATDRHTALGDARWALAQYAAVYGCEVLG